jgi:hypothetical protein
MSTARKMTETIQLVLISSALILTGCGHSRDDDAAGGDFDTQDGPRTTARQGTSRGSSGSHSGGHSYVSGGGGSRGYVSGGQSGVVSRGGFGAAGHAAGS